MAFVEFLKPFCKNLKLEVSSEAEKRLEEMCRAMTDDPLYSSVSKISTSEDIAMKHVLDSIAPLALPMPCWKSRGTILDLGTGGGFPAFPLSIVLSQRTVYAVDAKNKAVDFVRRIGKKLNRENLFPLLARAEELGRDKIFREKIDLVVCRAVASVRVLLELCLPLVKIGGYALFYKGPGIDDEISEAGKAIGELKIKKEDISIFRLSPPLLPFERGYLLISKTSQTPDAYPRRNGIPASNPL